MNFKLLLTSAFVASSLISTAQSGRSNVAYAITGDGNKDFVWMNIRQVDLKSGQVTKNIFERSKTNYVLTDVNTKKSVDQTAIVNGDIFSTQNYPTTTYVAAAAYDKNSNKLFFTPMRMAELRWLDMDSKADAPKFYTLSSDALKFGDVNNEANNITRMVIAADGNGYALTNDAMHLIRFTTGKKPVITDLGNVVDADASNGSSIHNKCSSWGGDMIADAFGKLYVITAGHNVYVIDPATRIATFKGSITGLPAGYTTNGAVVSADGKIVVSSATSFEGYYKLSIEDLAATKLEGSDIKYNASDLANGNLLFQEQADAASKFTTASLPVLNTSNADAKVFPNPVTTSSFNVLLDGQKEGRYTILLTDIAGRTVQSKSVNIIKGAQVETINISNRPSKGMYMVKVVNEQNQVVLTEKIVLQ